MKISNILKAYLLKRLTKKKFVEFDIKDSKNILFLRYDRIGDMVITTPVFRELKRFYPNINIIVLASKVNKSVLENNPFIDEIYICKKNNIFTDFFLLIKLRKKRVDVCVEFDHSVIPHAIFRIMAIKPKKVISVFKEGRYGVAGHELELYDFYTDEIKDQHLCEICLSTLKPFGVKPKSMQYDLFITNSQEKVAKEFLENYLDKKIVGVNLEGAVKGKKIDFFKFKEIIEGLYLKNNNIQIIVLTSPKNYNSIRNKILDLNFEYVAVSYLTDSILDAAAIIKHMDLVITPDTSIVHIASAFNVPIVSIHEDNLKSYKLFAPKSDNFKTVFSEFSDKLGGYNVGKIINKSIELLDKDES